MKTKIIIDEIKVNKFYVENDNHDLREVVSSYTIKYHYLLDSGEPIRNHRIMGEFTITGDFSLKSIEQIIIKDIINNFKINL